MQVIYQSSVSTWKVVVVQTATSNTLERDRNINTVNIDCSVFISFKTSCKLTLFAPSPPISSIHYLHVETPSNVYIRHLRQGAVMAEDVGHVESLQSPTVKSKTRWTQKSLAA